MIPTTKIRQETMVFTYLNAFLISVGFTHMGGNEPRGRAGCSGGSGTEALFLESSEALELLWESRTNREAPTSATIRRHSRAMALILARASHSRSRTFAHSLKDTQQSKKYTLRDTHRYIFTHSHTSTHWALTWAWEHGSMSELVCPAKKVDERPCYTLTKKKKCVQIFMVPRGKILLTLGIP